MSDSALGIVRMENGTVAEILFHENGRYEVSEYLGKASGLGSPRLSEIGKLLFEMPRSDEGGGEQNYSRIDLV